MEGLGMADEPNPSVEPPLVVKVDESLSNANSPIVAFLQSKLPPRLYRVFLVALFWCVTLIWCVIFLATQVSAAALVTAFMMASFTLQAPDATRFIEDQLKGFSDAFSKVAPIGERSTIPPEFGQSLACGMLGAQLASLGLILIVFPWRIGSDWKRQIGFKRPAILHMLLALLLVPGFMMLSGGIQALLQEVGISQPAMNEPLNDLFRSFPWSLTFLAVGFGPGFVEEMWCRGFLGRRLSARYGLVIGVTVTSILFGLLHGSLSYAIPTAIMGAYLHFVYLASRSIWVSITLHTLNNGVAILATLTGKAEQLDADPQRLNWVIYLASFSLVLFASISLWTSRFRIVPIQGRPDGSQPISDWKPEYPGISAPTKDSGQELRRGRPSPAAVVFTFLSFAMLAYLLSK